VILLTIGNDSLTILTTNTTEATVEKRQKNVISQQQAAVDGLNPILSTTELQAVIKSKRRLIQNILESSKYDLTTEQPVCQIERNAKTILDGGIYIYGSSGGAGDDWKKEGTRFMTGRGYQQPLINAINGSSVASVETAGWKYKVLYTTNNKVVANDVEKAFHEFFNYLPVGNANDYNNKRNDESKNDVGCRFWRVNGEDSVGGKRDATIAYPYRIAMIYYEGGLPNGYSFRSQ
jgi:hypothetical protein